MAEWATDCFLAVCCLALAFSSGLWSSSASQYVELHRLGHCVSVARAASELLSTSGSAVSISSGSPSLIASKFGWTWLMISSAFKFEFRRFFNDSFLQKRD